MASTTCCFVPIQTNSVYLKHLGLKPVSTLPSTMSYWTCRSGCPETNPKDKGCIICSQHDRAFYAWAVTRSWKKNNNTYLQHSCLNSGFVEILSFIQLKLEFLSEYFCVFGSHGCLYFSVNEQELFSSWEVTWMTAENMLQGHQTNEYEDVEK